MHLELFLNTQYFVRMPNIIIIRKKTPMALRKPNAVVARRTQGTVGKMYR
jgi:hypothetical protein